MEKEAVPTPVKNIFCAGCQDETGHMLTVDDRAEITAACTECGRTIKFPGGLTKSEFKELCERHAEANKGQVTAEEMDQRKQASLAAILDD